MTLAKDGLLFKQKVWRPRTHENFMFYEVFKNYRALKAFYCDAKVSVLTENDASYFLGICSLLNEKGQELSIHFGRLCKKDSVNLSVGGFPEIVLMGIKHLVYRTPSGRVFAVNYPERPQYLCHSSEWRVDRQGWVLLDDDQYIRIKKGKLELN